MRFPPLEGIFCSSVEKQQKAPGSGLAQSDETCAVQAGRHGPAAPCQHPRHAEEL